MSVINRTGKRKKRMLRKVIAFTLSVIFFLSVFSVLAQTSFFSVNVQAAENNDELEEHIIDTISPSTNLEVGSGEGGSTKGNLVLNGLDEGTWWLKEITAPGGYNLLAGPVEIEITDSDDGVLDGKVTGESGGLVSFKVENDSGFQLPVTGGMGTVLFTAVGVLLMGAAVVLVIAAMKNKKAVGGPKTK